MNVRAVVIHSTVKELYARGRVRVARKSCLRERRQGAAELDSALQCRGPAAAPAGLRVTRSGAPQRSGAGEVTYDNATERRVEAKQDVAVRDARRATARMSTLLQFRGSKKAVCAKLA